MQEFSPADGFMDVKEDVDEMIKFVGNEPSVGLFFVQQHARTSMPILLEVKDKIVEKIHEVTLHTEDIEDSICVVKSMTEYGLPIADEMIKGINKSLLIMSTSQPKKGLIRNPSWNFSVQKNSSDPSRDSDSSGRIAQQEGRNSGSYLSAVFSSAKQKAAALRWTQSHTVPESRSDLAVVGSDELPLSSHLDNDPLDEAIVVSENVKAHHASSVSENYDKFRSDHEARLEEWLQDPEGHSRRVKAID